MYIDYLTLLLINMSAGFALLAGFVWWLPTHSSSKHWVPAFSVVGAIALAFGAWTTVTWPLPGSFNIAFGEMSVFFGAILLGIALAISREWSPLPMLGYAFFAGLAAVLIGVRILHLGLTKSPAMAGIGFILSGMAGLLALPTMHWFAGNRVYRSVAVLVLAVIAIIWALTGYLAYWDHLQSFHGWMPPSMRP